MSDLSDPQKALLRELKADSRWQGIIDYIRSEPDLRYKPDEDDEQKKLHRWLYESGRARENADILYILTLGGQ